MSKDSKYQEGVITLSNGKQVPFLCRPLSMYVDITNEDEVNGISVSDIKFFPEVDRSEEIKNEILKDKIGELPDDESEDSEREQADVKDGLGWDDAY